MSRYWTGTSLQWRLMRGNIIKKEKTPHINLISRPNPRMRNIPLFSGKYLCLVGIVFNGFRLSLYRGPLLLMLCSSVVNTGGVTSGTKDIVHVFHADPVFSSTPRVFLHTSCFPPYLVCFPHTHFSHTPGHRTPVLRPRVFHNARIPGFDNNTNLAGTGRQN